MRICFLTQTAIDISDYYKNFFAGHDLFFLTFKAKNERAIAYLPKSSWSEGRNRLWEEVRGKYDYYVFMDDDLKFMRPRIPGPALAVYFLHKARLGKPIGYAYKQSGPEFFLRRLAHYLTTYSPEVLSVIKFHTPTTDLDVEALRQNSFVRRMGWFDAEFTVLSQLAASKLLPYDTKISGWCSAQIPVYTYAYNVFGSKAIIVTELAADNTNASQGYIPGYNGVEDCRAMLNKMSSATGKDFDTQFHEHSGVDTLYGAEQILSSLPQSTDTEDYASNYAERLLGLENLIHSNLNF